MSHRCNSSTSLRKAKHLPSLRAAVRSCGFLLVEKILVEKMQRAGTQGRPILPLQAVDFNGDTLTDVLLFTRNGLYGYGQVRHPTGVPFAALLASLIVAMAVVYFTHQTGSKSGTKSGRATDRVD